MLDLKAHVVDETFHVGMPGGEISSSLLEGRDPGVGRLRLGGGTESFQVGDALGVVRVPIDVVGLKGGEALLDGDRRRQNPGGLQPGEALLQRGRSVGGNERHGRLSRLQRGQTRIDSCSPVSRRAIPLDEAMVQLVKSLVHRVEEEFERGIHGSETALEAGKMVVIGEGVQDRTNPIPNVSKQL